MRNASFIVSVFVWKNEQPDVQCCLNLPNVLYDNQNTLSLASPLSTALPVDTHKASKLLQKTLQPSFDYTAPTGFASVLLSMSVNQRPLTRWHYVFWNDKIHRAWERLWGWSMIDIIFFKRKTCCILGFFLRPVGHSKCYFQTYIMPAKTHSFLDK